MATSFVMEDFFYNESLTQDLIAYSWSQLSEKDQLQELALLVERCVVESSFLTVIHLVSLAKNQQILPGLSVVSALEVIYAKMGVEQMMQNRGNFQSTTFRMAYTAVYDSLMTHGKNPSRYESMLKSLYQKFYDVLISHPATDLFVLMKQSKLLEEQSIQHALNQAFLFYLDKQDKVSATLLTKRDPEFFRGVFAFEFQKSVRDKNLERAKRIVAMNEGKCPVCVEDFGCLYSMAPLDQGFEVIRYLETFALDLSKEVINHALNNARYVKDFRLTEHLEKKMMA